MSIVHDASRRARRFFAAMLLATFIAPTGYAQSNDAKPPAAAPDPAQAQALAAFEAANIAKRDGPVEVKFVDQAILKLPAGWLFKRKRAAKQSPEAIADGSKHSQ